VTEAPDPDVIRLADAITHQPGGIVSRVLLKQAQGSVTLFGFDGGQELSEHTAPFEALVQMLDGVAIVTIAGASHRVAAGDLIRLPAGVPHGVRAETRMTMMLVMIRGASPA